MFCNTCGSKLKKGDKMCTSCGAPADQGETCGGFWGLVGTTPAPVSAPAPAPVSAPGKVASVAVQAPGKPAKKKLPMTFWYGLAAALALLLLIQTIRIGVISSELRSRTGLVDAYHQWWVDAYREGDQLKAHLELANEELEALRSEVTELREKQAEEVEETEAAEETEATEATEVPEEETEATEATEVPEEEAEATEAPETEN